MGNSVPHVFISYVRENREIVDQLAAELFRNGVTVWLDRNDIEPGARWKDAIKKAIREGKFFIACFSEEFNQRDRTHMNEELSIAIEELRTRPAHRTWFIPVLLNETHIPTRQISSVEDLSDLQMVNLSEDWDEGINRIIRVLGHEDPVLTRIRLLSEIINRPFDGDRVHVDRDLVHAIKELGDLMPVKKPAVLELLKASKNPNREIQIASLNALARVGAAALEAVPDLIATLKDRERYSEQDAVEALAKVNATALPALAAALIADGDQHLSRVATDALAKIGPAAGEVVPALLRLFEEVALPNFRAQTAADIALREMGEAAVPGLIIGLKDPDFYVRRAAARALGMKAWPAAVPALAAALNDPEQLVRRAAAQALGWPMAAEAVPALVAHLEDPDLHVRRAIAEALGNIGPGAVDALSALGTALEDPDAGVRENSAEAMRKIGPARAIGGGMGGSE
jgi:HEAT repeat protein